MNLFGLYSGDRLPLPPGWEQDSISLIYTNFRYDQVARIRSAGRGRFRIEFNGSRLNKKYFSETEAMGVAEQMCNTAPLQTPIEDATV